MRCFFHPPATPAAVRLSGNGMGCPPIMCPSGSRRLCHSVLLIVSYVGHRLSHPTLSAFFFSWKSCPSLDLANASSCLESRLMLLPQKPFLSPLSRASPLCPALDYTSTHFASVSFATWCLQVRNCYCFGPQCIPAGPELNI